MAKLMTEQELAAERQRIVAECCRWLNKEMAFTDQKLVDGLWHAMGYEGALNQFTALDVDAEAKAVVEGAE